MEILLFFHAKNIAIHIAIQIKILQYIAIRNFQPIPSPNVYLLSHDLKVNVTFDCFL